MATSTTAKSGEDVKEIFENISEKFSQAVSMAEEKLGGVSENVFSSLGKVFQFPEYLLDAVTGLSGTGPAYVFVLIEALADGGVLAGLPRREALILSAQTVMGAAKLLLEQNLHPGVLKDAIMSPGGTTASALQLMEARGFRSILIDAVEAATKKSQFLSLTDLRI